MIGDIPTTEANTLLRRASAASTYLLSQRTALESKPGRETKIYELVSKFTLKSDPSFGYGISEFLISRKTT